MYSLNCKWWTNSFETLSDLEREVLSQGMDPNYEILKDGKRTGETLADLIQF